MSSGNNHRYLPTLKLVRHLASCPQLPFLEQNEQRMAVIEQEKSDLEMQLSGPLPSTEIAEAGRRLKALSDEMAALEERWMWLSEKLQDLQTQA